MYLSSSGIRVLLHTSHDLGCKGGQLILSGLSAELLQIFQIAGLDTVFTILQDVDQAVAYTGVLDKNVCNKTFFIGENSCEAEITSDHFSTDLYLWKEPVLTGYDSLQVATGQGAFGETLYREAATPGFFFTLYQCAGLIPDDTEHAPDFRIVNDTSQGSMFVEKAYSVKSRPRVQVTVNGACQVTTGDILASCRFPGVIHAALCAAVFLDRDPEKPSLTVLFQTGSQEWKGGSFLLHHMIPKQPGETLEQYCHSLLTWENVEGVTEKDQNTLLTRPVCWLFYAENQTDASCALTQVVSPEEALSEDTAFLTRKLYTDSRKVEIQRLHGGYSASTFRVCSYDHEGRVLRPTVLKTGDAPMIQREAERCDKYAMPYILNNSAMVLGTSFYCRKGALRYNFVGIGGEETTLKWLKHYFDFWPVSDLEPLFDKIFLKILKPWYGQPVREVINPYADHDPTKTFFPDLVECATKSLGIPAHARSFQLAGSERI